GAGVRVAAHGCGTQRVPVRAVVKLEFLERPGRIPHRDVVAPDDSHLAAAGLLSGADPVDIAPDLARARWSRRISHRVDADGGTLGAAGGAQRAQAEVHQHLAVAGLDAAPGDLHVLDRTGRRARTRRLVA